MTDDLVNKLRAIDHLSIEDCYCQSPLYAEAAYRIEQLMAERDALVAQRDAVPFDTDALGMGLEITAKSTIRIVTKERDEALADNARLREIGTEMAESIEGNYYLPGVATRWRAALTGKEPSHE
jgi:hypothetical protein